MWLLLTSQFNFRLQFYKLLELSSQPLMKAQNFQARKWPHGTVLFLLDPLPALERECTHSSQIIQCAFVWTVTLQIYITTKPIVSLLPEAHRPTPIFLHLAAPTSFVAWPLAEVTLNQFLGQYQVAISPSHNKLDVLWLCFLN